MIIVNKYIVSLSKLAAVWCRTDRYQDRMTCEEFARTTGLLRYVELRLWVGCYAFMQHDLNNLKFVDDVYSSYEDLYAFVPAFYHFTYKHQYLWTKAFFQHSERTRYQVVLLWPPISCVILWCVIIYKNKLSINLLQTLIDCNS